jgi:hypothetical protein
MAKRRATPPPVPEAVRDAVERTVQATLGQADPRGRAHEARTRAQEVVDDVLEGARRSRGRAQEAVEGVVKGAEQVGGRVRGALDEARPATHDDVKALGRELRAIARRLDAIEARLPDAGSARSSSRSAKKG